MAVNYRPNQQDVEVIQQKKRIDYVRITVKESKEFTENQTTKVSALVTIGELQGYITGGSYNLNVDSDIRRNCSMTAVVVKGHELLDNPNFVWVNKYAQIEWGCHHFNSQSILWYPIGVYKFSAESVSYDATSKTISFDMDDLMSDLNGVNAGTLEDFQTKIPYLSNIRNTLLSTIKQLGFIDRFIVEDIGRYVPYDLTFSPGQTVYDIIKELCELYVGYEIFFDENGRFVFQRIPDDEEDDCVLTKEQLSPLVVSEQVNLNIGDIRNHTVIWGKCLEADYFTSDCIYEDGIYTLVFDIDAVVETGVLIGFKAPADNTDGSKIRIVTNSGVETVISPDNAYPIVNYEGEEVESGRITAGTSYVINIQSDSTCLFYGEYQVRGEYEANDNNCPNNPFNVDKIGRRTQVLSGGEYDNIYTSELAAQRAKYETLRACRYNDSLTLNMMCIPWLSGNEKIEYEVKSLGEVRSYIVKGLNFSFGSGTMTLNAVRCYPDEPLEN